MSWDSPNSKGRKTIWVSEKHFTKVWNYKYGLLGKKQDFKQKPEFAVPQKRKKKLRLTTQSDCRLKGSETHAWEMGLAHRWWEGVREAVGRAGKAETERHGFDSSLWHLWGSWILVECITSQTQFPVKHRQHISCCKRMHSIHLYETSLTNNCWTHAGSFHNWEL